MNPYTYKRRKGHLVAETASPQSGKPSSWFSEIVNAKLSSVVAIAFVFFTAGSVAAMTAAAYPEISSVVEPGAVLGFHSASAHSQVLGTSTTQPIIDDTALEAGAPTGGISAKTLSFDSTVGRWDYNINYEVNNLTGSATLDIGNYIVQSGITAPGVAETGAILKPSMTYYVWLWATDPSGSKQVLTHIVLKTPKAKTTSSTTYPPCVQSNSSNFSAPTTTLTTSMGMCIKKDDGSVMCTGRPTCLGNQENGGGNDSSTPGSQPYPHYPQVPNTTSTPPGSPPQNPPGSNPNGTPSNLPQPPPFQK